MTEDEAKMKWCPFVRFRLTGTDISVNRDQFSENPLIAICDNDHEGPVFNCVGSACMAWRWDNPWTSRTEEGHGGDVLVRLKRKPGEPALGFCGLAGAPQ